MSRTKIVATIGPATKNKETIVKMIKSGLDVVRLNFSHGSHKSHLEFIKNVRNASRETGRPIAILQDLQGPRIRLGVLPKNGIKIKNNQTIYLSGLKNLSEKEFVVPVAYEKLHTDLKKNDRVLIEDGTIELIVKDIKDDIVICTSSQDAILKSKKGMNFPDSNLSIGSITGKDIKDLEFGIKNGVDFVALSFIEKKDDILKLNQQIDRIEKKFGVKQVEDNKNIAHKKKRTRIVAKIERPQAVKNIDEIINVADAVMIARGDLGIEMSLEKLPLIQKDIIEKCLAQTKPVIVATQMLNSMINAKTPTRAEVSDVANAIIDGTDAVMLSGETSIGKYPVETIKMMEKISKEAEIEVIENTKEHYGQKRSNITEIVGLMANELTSQLNAKAIVCTTVTGFTARNISRFKPSSAIIAVTPYDFTQRQLCLSWGVIPIILDELSDFDKVASKIKNLLLKNKFCNKGDIFIFTAGHPFGYGDNNLIKVDKI